MTFGVLAALAIVAAGAGTLYLLLRTIFIRAADYGTSRIEAALTRLAQGPALSSIAGESTPWARYARAANLSEAGAREDFSRRIERLARLMDTAVTLPVIGPVGLDAVLGLLPLVGDASSAAIALSLVARSLRFGLPRELVTRMLANVLIDLLLGAVPVIGDLADIWYKANTRNVALLREHLDKTRGAPP